MAVNKLHWPREGFFEESLVTQLRNIRKERIDKWKKASADDIRQDVEVIRETVGNYFQVGIRPHIASYAVEGERKIKGGTVSDIVLCLDNGARVSLVIGMPDNPVRPNRVIIGLHGTHESREYYLDILSHPPRRIHENSAGFLAPVLQAGYAVVCPDLPTFGRSYPGDDVTGQRFTDYVMVADELGRMIGRSYAAEAVGEIMAVVDLVESYPGFDAPKCGITGFSLGGMLTTVAAACDERLAVAADCAGTASYERTFEFWPENITKISYIYGSGLLGSVGDQWNLAAAVAPRPQLRIACIEDRHIQYEGVRDIMEILEVLYGALGRKDAAKMVQYPGGHDIRPGMAENLIEWFNMKMP